MKMKYMLKSFDNIIHPQYGNSLHVYNAFIRYQAIRKRGQRESCFCWLLERSSWWATKNYSVGRSLPPWFRWTLVRYYISTSDWLVMFQRRWICSFQGLLLPVLSGWKCLVIAYLGIPLTMLLVWNRAVSLWEFTWAQNAKRFSIS